MGSMSQLGVAGVRRGKLGEALCVQIKVDAVEVIQDLKAIGKENLWQFV